MKTAQKKITLVKNLTVDHSESGRRWHVQFNSKGTSAQNLIKQLTKNKSIDDFECVTMNVVEHLIPTSTHHKLTIVNGREIAGEMYTETHQQLTQHDLFEFAKKEKLMIPSFESGMYLRGILDNEDIKSMGYPMILVMHNPVMNDAHQVYFTCLTPEKSEDCKFNGYICRDEYPETFGYVFIDPSL